MLLSLVSTLRRWRSSLSLRLSWNQLPPLTTHALTFLAGTLLLEPKAPSSAGPPASSILLPATKILQRSKLERHRGRPLVLARGQGATRCLALVDEFRLWSPSSGKPVEYLVLPAAPRSLGALQLLLEDRELSLVPASVDLTPCEAAAQVIYD